MKGDAVGGVLRVHLLLVALALLATAGQAIAHVNDIILLYVGGHDVTFMLYSPY